jgi:two-component system, cell cycle sensor histidine kinase DivJ
MTNGAQGFHRLPMTERLRLFRRGRLAAAGVTLGLVAPLMLASAQPPVVAIALLLAGLLPAVVAIETRRPARLDRAVIFLLLILMGVLTGGVLRGLPAAGAALLVGLAAIEACIVSRRRLACVGLGLIGVGAVATAAAHAPGAAGAWPAEAALAALAGTAAAILINSLAKSRFRQTDIGRQALALRNRAEAALGEVLIGIDRSGLVCEAGGNTARTLGLHADALHGRGLVELTLVADRPALLKACGDAFADRQPTAARIRLRTSAAVDAPRYRWVELSFSGASRDGIMPATVADSDAAAADNERPERAAAGTADAEAAHAAFFASLSHELRTPLNAIVGFSDLLANPETSPSDPARVREYAGMVHEAGQQLARKVASMIDIARLRSGAYEADVERADLSQTVAEIVAAFQREAGSRATVQFIDGGAPIEADVDARALRGALDELLSNAVRHGGRSPVTVAIAVEGSDAAIAVMDSGAGIPRAHLGQLSHALAQTASAASQENALGVGLTHARDLMALHGGSISIASRLGAGATVTLRLPLRARRSNVVRIGAPASEPPMIAHEGARKHA